MGRKRSAQDEGQDYVIIRHFENTTTREEALKRIIQRHMSMQISEQEGKG